MFPGILKWYDVVTKEVTLVHPVQFACETMATRSVELQRLGNIDAAVNGGIAKYRRAFFSSEFCSASQSGFNSVEQSSVTRDGMSQSAWTWWT